MWPVKSSQHSMIRYGAENIGTSIFWLFTPISAPHTAARRKPPLNISSAIVYARPGTDAVLRERLTQVQGVEVHAASEDGKIIVTIDAENDRAAIDVYEALGRIDDVLNIAMIFQQTESHPDQELVKCK